jgi:hypothetical protein
MRVRCDNQAGPPSPYGDLGGDRPGAGPGTANGGPVRWQDGSVTASTALRFRQNGAILVAVLIAFVSTVPVAGSGSIYAPLILVPLAIGLWAWRSGTDVDAAGLHVRAVLGTRSIAWGRVAELAADPRGRVSALLTDGNVIRLTAVRAADLPAVVAAAGEQLPGNG